MVALGLESLPSELLLLVLSELDTAALLSLAQVSEAFHHDAVNALYRRVFYVEDGEPGNHLGCGFATPGRPEVMSINSGTCIKHLDHFRSALSRSARLRRLVREASFCWESEPGSQIDHCVRSILPYLVPLDRPAQSRPVPAPFLHLSPPPRHGETFIDHRITSLQIDGLQLRHVRLGNENGSDPTSQEDDEASNLDEVMNDLRYHWQPAVGNLPLGQVEDDDDDDDEDDDEDEDYESGSDLVAIIELDSNDDSDGDGHHDDSNGNDANDGNGSGSDPVENGELSNDNVFYSDGGAEAHGRHLMSLDGLDSKGGSQDSNDRDDENAHANDDSNDRIYDENGKPRAIRRMRRKPTADDLRPPDRELQQLHKVFATPTLDRLTLEDVGGDAFDTAEVPAWKQTSNVTYLCLQGIGQPGPNLNGMLSWPRALRVLDMSRDEPWAHWLGSVETDALGLIRALWPTRHTLEALQLGLPHYFSVVESTDLGMSFRDFPRLRFLAIASRSLHATADNNCQPTETMLRCMTRLPPNLETLQIQIHATDWRAFFQENTYSTTGYNWLSYIAEIKPVTIPKLRQLLLWQDKRTMYFSPPVDDVFEVDEEKLAKPLRQLRQQEVRFAIVKDTCSPLGAIYPYQLQFEWQ